MSPLLTPEMTGIASPSPLQYAFGGKHAPHAGRGGGELAISVGAAQQQLGQLLQQKGSGRQRALYIHIPFCRVRCTFCTFFQHATSTPLVDGYFALLLMELAAKTATPWAQSAPFDAVYVGGGTPTDLQPWQIRELGLAIRGQLPLADDCEITLEGRLNRYDDERHQAALAGGFNRLSFGVQSFDTQVRRAAKRLDGREAILSRLQQLSASGSATLVIDLLYGLPYHNRDNWQQDLEDTLASGVDGVDLYQLIRFGSASLQRSLDQGRLPEPMASPERALLFNQGAEFFARHGWRQLSSCHWARTPREQSRYNSLAKNGGDILAVGAGGGGHLGGFSYMQHRDADHWRQDLEAGRWPLAVLSRQPPDQSLVSAVVGGCDRGRLQPGCFAAGAALFRHCQPLFTAWQAHGLAEARAGVVELTRAGQFWSVNLAQGMLAYLRHNPFTGDQPPALPTTAPAAMAS